jgi:hypothetical protein
MPVASSGDRGLAERAADHPLTGDVVVVDGALLKG